MTDTELFDTIAHVDPGEWEELAKGNVTAGHAWLRLVEDTSLEQRQCRCLLAREGSRLQAAIFFWDHLTTDSRNTLDYVLFGRLDGMAGFLGLTALPAFVANEASGHHQTVLFRDDLSGADRCRLLSRMLDVLENTAALKNRTICFRGIPADDADLAAVFSSRRYLSSPELPVCCLDIRWESFGEYLRWLRKQHHRTERNIHREINMSRRAGITIQRLDEPSAVSGRLHALADSHYRRLNGRPFPFQPRFFEQVKARLGDKAVIYAAVREGLILGVQVRLSSDGHATVPIIGIDPENTRKDAVYFNLGYNNTIRDAIEEGLRRVRLGTLVYDVKIRRGCRLSWTHLYLRPRNGFRGRLMRYLMIVRTWRIRRMLSSIPGDRSMPGPPDVMDDEVPRP